MLSLLTRRVSFKAKAYSSAIMYSMWFNLMDDFCAQIIHTNLGKNFVSRYTDFYQIQSYAKQPLDLRLYRSLYSLLALEFGRLFNKNGNLAYVYFKLSIKVHDFQYHVKKYNSCYKSCVSLPTSTCLNRKLIYFYPSYLKHWKVFKHTDLKAVLLVLSQHHYNYPLVTGKSYKWIIWHSKATMRKRRKHYQPWCDCRKWKETVRWIQLLASSLLSAKLLQPLQSRIPYTWRQALHFPYLLSWESNFLTMDIPKIRLPSDLLHWKADYQRFYIIDNTSYQTAEVGLLTMLSF